MANVYVEARPKRRNFLNFDLRSTQCVTGGLGGLQSESEQSLI